MKTVGLIFGSLIIVFLLFLIVISALGPETYVYLGRQVPKKFKKEVRELGLLDEGEEIKYFYSNGLIDIKDGIYFVTDKKLVVYCQEWEEPKTLILFDEITTLDVEYDDSFVDDSFIWLETEDGLEVEFPVSSEKNRDRKFFEYLLQRTGLEQGREENYEAIRVDELESSVDTIQE